jgi:glutamate dehydrogenase
MSAPLSGRNFRAPSTAGDLQDQVADALREAHKVPADEIDELVQWYFQVAGVHQHYFETMEADDIARHVSSLYAAKTLRATSDRPFDLYIEREHADRAMFVAPSSRSPAHHEGRLELERHIERDYLSMGLTAPSRPEYTGRRFRMQAYRTLRPVDPSSETHLRFYFLQQPEFVDPDAPADCLDLQRISDRTFLAEATDNTLDLYAAAMQGAMGSLNVHVSVHDIEGETWEKRIILAFRHDATHSFFSGIVSLWGGLDLRSVHKYIEQFSNGITVHSVYLRPREAGKGQNSTESEFAENVRRVANLVPFLFILPRTGMSGLPQLGFAEHAYAFSAWKFAYMFLKRYSDDYHAVAAMLGKDPALSGTLVRLKKQLRLGMFTEEQIRQTIAAHPEVIKMLYEQFEARHQPKGSSLVARRNSRSSDIGHDANEAEVHHLISSGAASEHDVTVLESLLTFNRTVLKTNFFKKRKAALCFRLDPSFLNDAEYETKPFGVFYLIGSDFVGFHVRFADVARGGIRVVRSATAEAHTHNFATLFDECFNLAMTQQSKNKDIPEGGSKGTILLSRFSQARAELSFRKYVDALLDTILIPDPEIVDHYGREEILFLGPDEGTADFMSWAALHARARGASFWKAFTTGKPIALGGIPHDTYGMTTRSVQQYVLGIARKLGVTEADWTKLQTGGPDGDLGSNAILLSGDRTTSVVDGSGVLHDPAGIDRAELTRLARARLMISEFDAAKIGPGGYRVLVADKDVTLPDGTLVESGMLFRNGFHLNPAAAADLFTPCGGRPQAVNSSNVGELISKDGVPRFKYIVEGANLFFTGEARLELEAAGVVLYKDASANKGGVTSSSLEVLAALALSDAEFKEHMCVEGGSDAAKPAFYQRYVTEVQGIIERNARLEFECIWAEHERTGTARSLLTDRVSRTINELNLDVQSSVLWESVELRRKVMAAACPPALIELIGVDTLLERVPEAYIRAIFGAWLAATFVYEVGCEPSPLAFFSFLFKFAGLSF